MMRCVPMGAGADAAILYVAKAGRRNAQDVQRESGSKAGDCGSAMSTRSTSSQRAVAIVSVVNSIALQMNALAMRVAVEAARAEHGKAFASVVNDAEWLANRSASAAKDIQSLIADVSRIGRAGQQLDQVTRQIATLVENCATAADSLNQQANGLMQTISKVRVNQASELVK
jgi:methyl-accepting chemotaxis protein